MFCWKSIGNDFEVKVLKIGFNIINQFLITTSSDRDERLQFAIGRLYEGLESYPDAYELKVIVS